MADKASRTVFIGNIPYGQSEEQIKEICGTVGQVVSFRPIYDSDTGRPKGFGFVEYADSDAASSAVRNLNGYKIEGRELRVAFSKRSDDDGGGGDAGNSGAVQPQVQMQHHHQQQHMQYQQTPIPQQPQQPPAGASSVGPLPPGVEVPAGLTCQDAISKTLSTLPPPQLLDILSQMKNLVTGDPGKATELLRQAPQLSYAIFQALLLMGLVDSSLMASVVQQAAAAGSGPQGPPSNVMPERPGPPPQPTPMQAYGAPVGHAPTPPQHQGMYGAPPPPQPTPQQMQPQQPQAPNQADLLRQVLDMPQAKVDALPPDQRAQIMQLKQQYGGRIGY